MNLPGSENEEENIYAGTSLNLEVDGDDLIKDSYEYKIGNSFKVGGDAAGMIGGGTSIGIGVSRGIAETGQIAFEGAAAVSSTIFKAVGSVLFVLGAVIGVGTGAYFTCKHFEEMIKYFENFYKENASKI